MRKKRKNFKEKIHILFVVNRRIFAGVGAILFGNIGFHKLYLKQYGLFVLYLLFAITFIPGIIGIIEGIHYLTMSDEVFNKKYPLKTHKQK